MYEFKLCVRTQGTTEQYSTIIRALSANRSGNQTIQLKEIRGNLTDSGIVVCS
jgi:hypothetical protein